MKMLILVDVELKAGGSLTNDPAYGGQAIVNARLGGRQKFNGDVVTEYIEDKMRESQWDDDQLFTITDITRVTELQ